MKTIVYIDPRGVAVGDASALDFANEHVGKTVRIATGVMLDAFRVLRVEGKIEKLIVHFEHGAPVEVDARGRLSNWPRNSLVDTSSNLMIALIMVK